MEEQKKSVFETLMGVNCDNKTDKKGKFIYLSWSVAWEYLKSNYPEATSKVYKDANGCLYHNDGRTCWCEVGVTIEGIEHIEFLQVMNSRNQSIPLNSVSSCDANKTIQRAMVKAMARHGLALNVYKGEDYPEETDGDSIEKEIKAVKPAKKEPVVTDPSLISVDEVNILKQCFELLSSPRVKQKMFDAYGISKIEDLKKELYHDTFQAVNVHIEAKKDNR